MITVGIVKDQAAKEDPLETHLRNSERVSLVFSGTYTGCLAKLIEASPDVVIIDMTLDHYNGTEAIHAIKRSLPGAQVLMLTTLDEEEHIYSSIRAGAMGFLLKKDPPQKITEAIESVHIGDSVINGKIARRILDHFRKPDKTTFEEFHLSKREKEILHHLMQGLSYKEIATTCFVSVDTINSHIRKIYSKLNVHSRAELVARYK
jgi:two-component system, NarL family, response regulator LiaR